MAQSITIRDLMDIVLSDVPNPEVQIWNVFEWQRLRVMEIAKWSLGASASVGLFVLASAFAKRGPDPAEFTVSVVLVLLTAVNGMYQLRRLRRFSEEYIASLEMVDTIKRIGPFIRLYYRSR